MYRKAQNNFRSAVYIFISLLETRVRLVLFKIFFILLSHQLFHITRNTYYQKNDQVRHSSADSVSYSNRPWICDKRNKTNDFRSTFFIDAAIHTIPQMGMSERIRTFYLSLCFTLASKFERDVMRRLVDFGMHDILPLFQFVSISYIMYFYPYHRSLFIFFLEQMRL